MSGLKRFYYAQQRPTALENWAHFSSNLGFEYDLRGGGVLVQT